MEIASEWRWGVDNGEIALRNERPPMLFCLYDDRPDAEIGLRLAIASIVQQCPSSQVVVYHPEPTVKFQSWLGLHAQVELRSPPTDGSRGWNCKPDLLIACLERSPGRVVWLDSDALVERDPSPEWGELDDETMIVAQEPSNQQRQGTLWRAEAWGLAAGREIGVTINTCVVGVTRRHLPILRAWRDLLRTPTYCEEQTRPFMERQPAMRGDQDVLGALLGSAAGSEVKLQLLRAGREVLHCGGLLMYGVADRWAGLPTCRPFILHALANKPWESPQPGSGWFPYLMTLSQELSPYVVRARSYSDAVGGDEFAWLERRSPVGRVLGVLGLGHHALRGLPLAIAGTAYKRLNRSKNG